jgi:hypothetical protein
MGEAEPHERNENRASERGSHSALGGVRAAKRLEFLHGPGDDFLPSNRSAKVQSSAARTGPLLGSDLLSGPL